MQVHRLPVSHHGLRQVRKNPVVFGSSEESQKPNPTLIAGRIGDENLSESQLTVRQLFDATLHECQRLLDPSKRQLRSEATGNPEASASILKNLSDALNGFHDLARKMGFNVETGKELERD